MLKVVALRKTLPQTAVDDAGFCHGSSGNSIIYRNIYDLTQNKIFLETSYYWIKETSKYKIEDDNLNPSINYSFHADGSKHQNFSLLEGLSGVLLMHLCYLNKSKNFAEETLFLKF